MIRMTCLRRSRVNGSDREIKAGRTRQAGEPASVLLERIRAERALVVAKNATTAMSKRRREKRT